MGMNMDTEMFGDGLRLKCISTFDTDIELPSEIDGVKVVSLGDRFMLNVRGNGTHTLMIPSTVTDMTQDAFAGSPGIVRIDYDGELEMFCGFKVSLDSECLLRCRFEGKPYEFLFPARSIMSFPEFDDRLLSSNMGIDEEIVLSRLSEPAMLTADDERQYRAFMRERIVPRATNAVVNGNISDLKHMESAGMLDGDTLTSLLERSIASGKTSVTSMLMSIIRRRHIEGKSLR